MKYNWDGMEIISFKEVERLHSIGKLCGCMYLYDNTEWYIDETYTWAEIKKHYENGGEFGIEKRNLKFDFDELVSREEV